MTAPVIVLGAAGFLGRHVCRHLSASGRRVFGLGHGDWSEAARKEWGISRWLASDVDIDSLNEIARGEKPDAIVHCAGGSAVSAAFAAPFDDYRRSVLSTAAVLEFVRHQDAPRSRVVLASSAAVYGDQGEVDLVEGSPCAPMSPYGYHKLAAENLCSSYHRFFGIQVSVVRLFSVYGEGLRKQLLWDAMNKFARGDDQFFGTGDELRDWIHVEDAARLLSLAATESDQAPMEVYNGAHDKASTREVLERLARSTTSRLEPRFNGQTHVGNPRRLTADCGHAHQRLRWNPRVELADGLARYATWFEARSTT